jgi:hypothetical protein
MLLEWRSPTGDKLAVLRTALDTHVPQIGISTASATYGFIGLVFGSLLAEALISAISGMLRRTYSRKRLME